MNEQLIEDLKEIKAALVSQLEYKYITIIDKAIAAITSVKSESAEDKRNPYAKTPEEIAQWIIDNRYPKSEQEKVSDIVMYHTIVKDMHDFANEDKKQHAIGFGKWIDKMGFYIDNFNKSNSNNWISDHSEYSGCAYTDEELYNEYLTTLNNE